MLKLTMTGAAARPIFVNPKAVAHVYPRTVHERVTPDPVPPGTTKIEYADRVEGSFVSFGASGDDADIAVMEGADEIAREVADSIGMYRIVDFAQLALDAAEREADDAARRVAAGCKLPAPCECDVCTDVPF